MIIFKTVTLLLIFICSTGIGILMANKYKKRVEELSNMKKALNIFETKMKYTYQPIPDIFEEISKNFENNIGYIFKTAYENMQNKSASDSWNIALDSINTNMQKNDIQVLKGLSKLLGKTDIQGQISEIELTDNFLNIQIEEAKKALDKNEKLYKNLGVITGLALVIILI